MSHSAHALPSVLSVQDAIFPVHPFSGLFALGREKNWRLAEMFPAFAVDERGQPNANLRINYLQARESLLTARHLGGADLGLLSGSRKVLADLGGMAQGMLTQPTFGLALAFGLEYQLIAGSMLQLDLEVGVQRSSLVSHALFDDRELQDFLDLDHLATALNAARLLPSQPFQLERLELRGNLHASRSALEDFFACPVTLGADASRLVFSSALLDISLAKVDAAQDGLSSDSSRHACDQELASIGVVGKQSLVRILVAMQCECRSVVEMAIALGISERSLHRLLVRERASYFYIAESVRFERAKRLLLAGNSTEKVAEALAYSDERSFRRAFKRWTLSSPAQYRKSIELE
ncbi:MAG: AraC family transcriptional regulator ligand-binding domain-containing protein [Pseudomonadota bacterium]